MLTSAGYPPDTVGNLQMNTLADCHFHAGTYLMSLAGVFLLLRAARQTKNRFSAALVGSTMLAGCRLILHRERAVVIADR
jgi:uncharacterized membrane protein